MSEAIRNRRSIRKYKPDSVPRPVLEEIIQAGILAPSSKNRQPWKFIVVTGASKAAVLESFRKGIEREKVSPLLPESAVHLKAAEYTVNIMEQAPAVIFIINRLGLSLDRALSPEERIYEICNAQSVGAAIENMTLTAAELGLGSLWICDTYFAQEELCGWLDTDGELIAALAVGYADEAPAARPRREIQECTEWRS